jgi:hypothetical protein
MDDRIIRGSTDQSGREHTEPLEPEALKTGLLKTGASIATVYDETVAK